MSERTPRARDILRRSLAPGIVWPLVCVLALGLLAGLERNARLADLTAQSDRLHAVASQRVDQHDAHLTALSAIAVAGAEQRPDLFHEVAGAVMRFYPRIIGIFLIPLDGEDGVLEIGIREADLRELIRDAAERSAGAPVLKRYPSDRPAYLIVKRSPNSDAARYGLALVIDAAALLDGDSDYWMRAEATRWLALPDGTPLIGVKEDSRTPQFTRALSSGTQPLEFKTAIRMTVADILPPGRVALVLAVIVLAAAAMRVIGRQRAKVRAAEARAELSGLETRLSHASRVNALGEMASGMAHELTQPLTAILAQAQAARRLAARGDTERVADVLEKVIGQTRRAGAILERLRTWTRPRERHAEPVDVRDCIHVAETLLAGQARELGARLTLTLPPTPLTVEGDRVELEQVLFNLMRNAVDAVAESADPGAREVVVEASHDGAMVVIDVSDTGPGIRPDVRDRLFTPFVTTRESGTGLGLALSHRLVERAGGDLTLVETREGARFRISLPLASAAGEAAE
ncbi:ATP-binding protein [Primorskyibacter aestuariivivens]|uniref:sensor histidine kinase n=1 Tax=Primorskyibacter aestuariivivens TaxID=1888912 RepID=UPI00230000EC|nr:ATP-binding protein [Primorskyibacter aestuariivivens]MDA7427923.1 ATP-binding protein [Primorskyibacter aestuariivivens]